MSWFFVVLLSFIEGLTEFLPISSTGHMILAGFLWNMPQTEFAKSFEIIVQLGAILAVFVTFWKFLWERKDLWIKLIAALIPTLAIGFVLYPLEKKYLLTSPIYTLIGLIIGAIAIWIVELIYSKKQSFTSISDLSIKDAVIIGISQAFAIFPGISRSAATVLTGMMLGQKRDSALQFSFLLALPVMAAATCLDVLKSGFQFTSTELLQLGLGLVISFAVAYFCVQWLLSFVQRKSFVPFAWYRVAVVIGFTILLVFFR
jgi:undecaprenyl-diphosphatase